MAGDVAGSCKSCGASVYQKHLDSGIAKSVNGKLICAHCVKEEEGAVTESTDVMAPIAFDTDDSHGTKVDLSGSRIMTTEDTLGKASSRDESRYKRQLDPRSPGASRCRTFHSKLSQGAVDFMDSQINQWLDENPDIVIKFTTATIGMFEGKHTEPNLILNLFY